MRKIIFSLFILLAAVPVISQTNQYWDALKWRNIGPFRGGRTVGAVGIPSQPNVFYIGVNNGGVWKTEDYGRTWKPIFDDQPTGSIGDVVVAPSNPNVVYVGSGEGIQRPDLSVGDGMYRSSDAGATWKYLGLKGVQQIGGLAVDPRDENKVFVAALGHPYGPNKERGIYRSKDGGTIWEQVLYLNENTGAIQVAIDPQNPDIIYADIWSARQGPWENGAWDGPESGIYKSTDGGDHWKKMDKGLPTYAQGLGRIGFCISPSLPSRLYATVDARVNGGLYRSDDGGENWYLLNKDNRLWGRGGDFAEIKSDPLNPEIVYAANVACWKSTDGGKNWDAIRGAPGGDDYHRIWINPLQPEIILLASDQGAIVTVNGGKTFSSWYNQPTAQFYHVSTDNDFPYNVYGGQQESGSVGISSRSNDGQINLQNWHPVGVEEYGYVAADPLNPNIIYGGKITRFDKRTGQVQSIAPEAVRSGKYRFIRTAPVLFSPVDNKTLYFAGNVLFKTQDGGNSWKVISPDLSRDTWEIPASVGVFSSESLLKMPRRGVIYTVAPSFHDTKTIWVGTDDGLIHITKDGGDHWTNITPPAITSWSKVSMMEASHFDPNKAFAAVNRIRCDDMHPHIYKTTDGGKSWTEIVAGLPEDPINTIREDPVRPGLLYAGSERAVYFSIDEGKTWHSLRQNMPATSIRDLVVKNDDLVVGTHGRGFWILDDITPLRQINATNGKTQLFKPQLATRVRWGNYTDTPFPQEEPAGENPPDGAVINFFLGKAANEISLEIYDQLGNLINKFSNKDTLYKLPALNIPTYWIRPQQMLSAKAGAQRFVWDLHYTPLNVPPSYPIGAVFGNTAPEPTSPWVQPGIYKVVLKADGESHSSVMQVRMDPRIKTSQQALEKQWKLSMICYKGRLQCQQKIAMLLQESEIVVNGAKLQEARKLENTCRSLLQTIQDSDWPPTTMMEKAVAELEKSLKSL